MSSKRLREFNEIWDDLAALSLVDGRDGAEHNRVFSEWIAAGQPPLLRAWVWSHANRRSDGSYPSFEDYVAAAARAEEDLR